MNTVASLPAKLEALADQWDSEAENARETTRFGYAAGREDSATELREILASPAIPPGYDRELIARMLFDYSNISGGRYEAQSARKQAQLISEVDNATGEAVTVNRSPAGEGGKE